MAFTAPPGARPAPELRDLTIPDGDSSTVRRLVTGAMRRRPGEILAACTAAVRAGGSEGHAAVELGRAFRAAAARDPGLVANLTRDPSLTVWLRCAANPSVLPGETSVTIRRRLLAGLAFNLALAGHLEAPVSLGPVSDPLVSLTLRRSANPGGGAVVFETRRLLCDGAPFPIDDGGFHAIDEHTVLALRDNNPLRMQEAHPDKHGNPIALGGHEAAAWRAALREALDVIGEHLPRLREEMRLLLRQVVPVGFDEQRHESASYEEAVGTVYMTLHPKVMTLAEALIHEFSHNKLNAVLELDPLLENSPAELYGSPVRPDLRPLKGVLLAVHAFLPVARLYEEMTLRQHPLAGSEYFAARYAKIRAGNHEAATVLAENARPTALGAQVLAEIQRWDAHYQ